MPPPVERSRQLHVMVSTEEERMLREVADARGLSASDVVRQLIREAHAATVGRAKKPRR